MLVTQPLTREEKVAGRAFRDSRQALLDQLNDREPADLLVPFFLRHYRHECPARGGVSTSFALDEVYRESPAYSVCTCGAALAADEAGGHHPRPGCQRSEVAAGRLAFVYKQGKCNCGLTGRSRTGRVVDAHTRKPMGRT